MKPFLKIFALTLLLMPFYSQAQFSTTSKIPTNTTVKSGVNLSNTSKLTLSKTTMDQLSVQILDKSISSIPKISLNPEDLERNRVKSWEITPLRPITPGMDISFMGNYSKNAFYIIPILNDRIQGQRHYQAVNLSVFTSMILGKDYRFTIELENPNEFPQGGEIRISLGGTNYFIKPERGRKEVYLLFSNAETAPQIISIGPAVVNDDWYNPKSYGVTKVKLEELAPAQ
ncbi:hypothetical protein [Algoriphagus boritolerans]|uniref:Uncharacterized protein n=1 Tax=Algoriphagus boritolerans DSM 17298 = JCM 18970 TaxID=1120964 RepID=A0A1H5T4P0_9BACT|nr:hypothetical protein [Algoriphagus boritolerans]SEF57872.1 hypothetical protein SAMN03080598_00695 [Algoriphagus boritolerans DSM 17298 = JCM 18970]